MKRHFLLIIFYLSHMQKYNQLKNSIYENHTLHHNTKMLMKVLEELEDHVRIHSPEELKSKKFRGGYAMYFYLFGANLIKLAFSYDKDTVNLLQKIVDRDYGLWFHAACIKFDRTHENYTNNRKLLDGLLNFYNVPEKEEVLLFQAMSRLIFEEFFIACEQYPLPKYVSNFMENRISLKTMLCAVRKDIHTFGHPTVDYNLLQQIYKLSYDSVEQFKKFQYIYDTRGYKLSLDPSLAEDEELTEELEYSEDELLNEPLEEANDRLYLPSEYAQNVERNVQEFYESE